MLSLKHSDDIAYNGVTNVARMDLYADTAADLTGVTSFDGITLLGGSTALDIATGDLYMMQSGGTWILQPSQAAFSNVYTKAEIDAIIANYYTKTEADDLFVWVTFTIKTDTLSLSFISDGSPLTAWTISGNGQQTGTPTPDNPVIPEFVGTLDNSDWTIPISCGGETTPVYLGQVQTVRKIRKLVLTGEESWTANARNNDAEIFQAYFSLTDPAGTLVANNVVCSHLETKTSAALTYSSQGITMRSSASGIIAGFAYSLIGAVAGESGSVMLNKVASYLASEYAAGHPVTLWYVLSTPTTGIINEPLAKIGDYCDELHSTDAGVAIPTAKGSNTLTVDTTLQPSEMTITGKIRET